MSTSEEISKKSYGGLTRSEVTSLLQPIIGLHGIEAKDDRIEFSVDHSCTEMSGSELPNETKMTAILYKDIASISPFEARVEVLLQCGELYIFSTTDNIKTHINTYSEGENMKSPKPITAQEVAGNIWNGLEKKLTQRNRKSKNYSE